MMEDKAKFWTDGNILRVLLPNGSYMVFDAKKNPFTHIVKENPCQDGIE